MTPQPNPAGRTRRNVDELRQLARDCGWRISSSIGYNETWRLIGSPDETLSIPTSREADRFEERYDAALARLTPEPPARAAAPAGAMEAIAEILREVNPRTWVEHTPPGLAYHLAQAAYPAMVSQAHADAAFIARQARAFLLCTYPPGMTLIASGRESFCTEALERWVSEHPLPQYTRAYVVTVAAETICEPGVGVYTVPTAQDGQR